MTDTPPEREPNSVQAGMEQDERQRRLALLAMLEDLQASHAQIERARKEWADAFDAVCDPIFIHDRNFRVVRANRAYADAAGMDIKDVIGKPYWEVFPKNTGPLPACARHMEKAEEEEEEEEEVKLDTGETYVSRAYAIRDEQGHYLHSIHIFEDITEKRRAEAERRLLSEAVQQSSGALLLTGPDLRMRYANPAFTRLFGYMQEEISGQPITRLAPPAELDVPAQLVIAERVRREGFWKGEAVRRARDGTVIPVYLAIAAMHDERGAVAGFVGSYLDLRPIKQAEEALRESEKTYRSLFENMLNGFALHEIVLDNEGRPRDYRFLEVNPAFERLTGLKAADLVGRTILEALPQTEPEWIERYGKVALTGEPMRFERFSKELGRYYSVLAYRPAEKQFAVLFEDTTDRKRAEQALQHSNRALKTLSTCNEVLVRATDEAMLLRATCRVIVEIGGYRSALISVPQHDEQKSGAIVASAGADPEYIASLGITWADNEKGQGTFGRAVRSGTTQVSQDTLADPGLTVWCAAVEHLGYGAAISLPLKNTAGTVFAVLSICAAEPNAFDPTETELLQELAEDLTYGVLTLRMHTERDRLLEEQLRSAERLRASLTDTIRAIALTVEKRDPYTAGHQQKVAELCIAIGRELGLAEERIEGLRLGALIHDIGKVYIPAEILNRPGKLSKAEFEMIQTHPEVGYDIVKDVKFPWPVGEMILQHHERMDGSGYPKALKGEEIILEARIMAVADTVEAMSSHRPYRPALGFEKALAEIEKNRGITYDAAAVDTCLKLFRKGDFSFSVQLER